MNGEVGVIKMPKPLAYRAFKFLTSDALLASFLMKGVFEAVPTLVRLVIEMVGDSIKINK